MGEDIKEIIGMLTILVVIISGVQWFFVRFTHWSVALLVTGLVALVISFFYVSLSHASPNGGSNGPDFSEFITPTLIIFASLLCGLALVCYLTQIKLPKIAFILPLSLIVIFISGRYMYQYIDDATFYYNTFSSCKIEVVNESASEQSLQEICFQNTSSGFSSTIQTNSNEKPYPTLIRAANKIIFRGYSAKDQQSFMKEFPFDYSLCKEKEGTRLGFCFWLRQKVILPLKIVLLPDDNVDLYLDNRLVNRYQLKEEDKKK